MESIEVNFVMDFFQNLWMISELNQIIQSIAQSMFSYLKPNIWPTFLLQRMIGKINRLTGDDEISLNWFFLATNTSETAPRQQRDEFLRQQFVQPSRSHKKRCSIPFFGIVFQDTRYTKYDSFFRKIHKHLHQDHPKTRIRRSLLIYPNLIVSSILFKHRENKPRKSYSLKTFYSMRPWKDKHDLLVSIHYLKEF